MTAAARPDHPAPATGPNIETATVRAMADDKPDPIANTAAFRAFSADEHGGEPARHKPTRSPMLFVTTIVLLVALVLGILAFAL